MDKLIQLFIAILAAWNAGSPIIMEMADRLSAEGYDAPTGDELRADAARLRAIPDLPTE